MREEDASVLEIPGSKLSDQTSDYPVRDRCRTRVLRERLQRAPQLAIRGEAVGPQTDVVFGLEVAPHLRGRYICGHGHGNERTEEGDDSNGDLGHFSGSPSSLRMSLTSALIQSDASVISSFRFFRSVARRSSTCPRTRSAATRTSASPDTSTMSTVAVGQSTGFSLRRPVAQ